jgi:hypothetical protein
MRHAQNGRTSLASDPFAARDFTGIAADLFGQRPARDRSTDSARKIVGKSGGREARMHQGFAYHLGAMMRQFRCDQ